MKMIKAIATALLLTICMAAQADRRVTVKANDGSDNKFHLSNRIVIDLTKDRPEVRNNVTSMIYNPDSEILLLIDGDLEDGIKNTKTEDNGKEVIYDLSGRKVIRPAKGIYIKDGKKVVLR